MDFELGVGALVAQLNAARLNWQRQRCTDGARIAQQVGVVGFFLSRFGAVQRYLCIHTDARNLS